MSYEVIGISVLWIFLYGYLIVASIDFGAGFFAYYAKVTKQDHIINKIISRYLSPVWEVTNVFLVFFFVGIVGFFPSTAYYYGSALLVPASFAIILIAIRGSFYAFENYGSKQSNIYMFLYGATGLFIPASLSVALTISEGGFITEQNGHVSLKYFELFTSPLAWSIVGLAIVSVLFISASFITYYASRANDIPALHLVRKWALFWATPTIIMALTTMIALSQRNQQNYENMIDLWWVFGLSMAFFLIAISLLYIGKYYGVAFIAIMLQFLFAFFGYGMAKFPYLLYPQISIENSVTNPSMGIALIVAFIAGLLLLVPSLILLMRLFLFDADYAKGKK
ncbi:MULTISPECIES: cytochrome d ubiquinol oxidase subunit II [Bacillaceae]|uniref:Cytochrome d ubiquinol oxidase subunit II n=1 Tax=Niallia taxi TaxID=2499688 RepID=A0A437K739_9BACI|nr:MULTISPECIES: cytochrome d ubiquinol oxidase subunit II [Bacillaceae]MCE4048656.1 cytochrome d ubiquinol oxidase subunit II [Bacillus sp. Au-Bac7]MCM3032062.1 cytochrome d ubiquinol oxidase subunit II [Niallia sp. MER 6]MDK8642976.1 cytochrome d ubiquinol oxidase subunit II [Niallia taxi]MED4038272.1 cytochrome d ubiquinol oxidase subunit II [Niallia taxi]MED4056626.1 cytochrome d ubiquinol oxidase subunit II [Niallia taxi]